MAWTKDALPIGAVVKAVGHPSRAPGSHGMTAAVFSKQDGTPLGPRGGRGETPARRSPAACSSFTIWLQDSAVAVWTRESPSIWAYPTVLMLHTVGLGVLVGANAVIDFRLLGFAPRLPVPSLHPALPFHVGGSGHQRRHRRAALRQRRGREGADSRSSTSS